MPKRASEAYESDDGFVEDAPSSKKSRASGKTNEMKRRDGKQEVDLAMHKDDNGDPYWELSKLRRVTVSEFKGKYMLNIREYYEKDGKTLPGKKGISLPVDQYTALLAVLPQVEAQLAEKGVKVPRPTYEGDEPVVKDNGDNEEEHKGRAKKANIELTSDEEE